MNKCLYLDISIVTYNSDRYLEPLIKSIVEQNIDLIHVTLIIHDNASSDNTISNFNYLITPYRRFFRGVIILTAKKNLGFGKGQNVAIQHGKGDLIFILNPDTELQPSCLSILLSEAMNDRNEVVAWEARQAPFEHPKIYDPVTLETPWVSCAAVLIRRNSFENVGGFDSNIFLYGEDVDLSWRLRENGAKLRYIPKAVVRHDTYSEPHEIKPHQIVGIIRSNLILRTRFGRWADIFKGIRMQIGVLVFPSRQYIPRQRRLVIKSLIKYLLYFWHFRFSSKRNIAHKFYDWEYSPLRTGAFYDISNGIGLKFSPKVSVLIRTTGRMEFLSQALASVANQTYQNIEVVVIEDGGGTLKSFLNTIKGLSIKYRALGEKKERCVVGNEAMRIASGEYFIFLDDDDLFYADHIEQLVAILQESGGKIAYSYAFEIPSQYSKDGNYIVKEGEYISRYQEPYSFLRLLRDNYIPINTVLFHRSLYEECGGFDEEILSMEDWNLWVRYSLEVHFFYNVPKTTALYRFPQSDDKRDEKYDQRFHFRDIARKKQASLPLNLTVGELLDLIKE